MPLSFPNLSNRIIPEGSNEDRLFVKKELQNFCARLAEVCPSVKQVRLLPHYINSMSLILWMKQDYARFLAFDESLFHDLFPIATSWENANWNGVYKSWICRIWCHGWWIKPDEYTRFLLSLWPEHHFVADRAFHKRATYPGVRLFLECEAPKPHCWFKLGSGLIHNPEVTLKMWATLDGHGICLALKYSLRLVYMRYFTLVYISLINCNIFFCCLTRHAPISTGESGSSTHAAPC